uniref:Uncharacterized protein n=1 Tax=Heterorhabditis bacteriophora TaxID=37862 RepID=A0A1I7W8E5_HETBA
MAVPIIPLVPALYILFKVIKLTGKLKQNKLLFQIFVHEELLGKLCYIIRLVKTFARFIFWSASDAKLSTEEIFEELKLVSNALVQISIKIVQSISEVDENGNTPKKILNGWPIISETLPRIKMSKYSCQFFKPN